MNNKSTIQLSRVGKAVLPTSNSTVGWAKQPAPPTCYLSTTPAHQSGVVLVISLIMLLLLMIIGVVGSQVTGLEEKMAGNSRDYNLAFQAAESALRVGEAATAAAPVLYTGGQPIIWANAIPTSGGTSYIIESMPGTTSGGGCPPCEGGAELPPVSVSWYRITARGQGGANAFVTLQSIYRR
jgi:type IV pilus assembly protein PilX